MMLVPVLCCVCHEGDAGIKLISILASQTKHFQHPTTQVVQILYNNNSIFDNEHTVFSETLKMLVTLATPMSYWETGLTATNVLLFDDVSLVNTYISRITTYLYKTVFEDVSWQDDTHKLLYCGYKM